MQRVRRFPMKNLQDLKAGQMVVQRMETASHFSAGCDCIGAGHRPVLDLLYHAYGIGGVFPRAGMDPAQC